MFIVLGACGDDVIDAAGGDDDDTDASRQDVTNLPPAKDTSTDAKDGSNADADSSKPDGDVPDGDVPDGDADAGPLFQSGEFVSKLAAAFCTNYDGCCQADDIYAPPAGTPTCAASIADPEFFRSDIGRTFFAGLLDGYYYNVNVANSEHIVVDDDLGKTCLDKIAALGCVRNHDTVAAADWKLITQTCSSALHGDRVADQDCYSDVECATGFSCQGATNDAAAPPGKCKVLLAKDVGVYTTGPSYSDSCSYRGFGSVTGLHTGYTATGDTCQQQQAMLDAACRPGDPEPFAGDDYNCASGACALNNADENAADGNVCSAFKWDPYACSNFSLP
jgi:hypothetical protein